MEIKIYPTKFDPMHELQAYQESKTELVGKFGATCIFIGTMRDFNEGDGVTGMELEHYPGMTEKQLADIVHSACEKWEVLDILVVHRVGSMLPGDPIVLVGVWSSHRGDAFDVCREIMESLKSKAPFWKKELLTSGDQKWVEENTDGYKKRPG